MNHTLFIDGIAFWSPTLPGWDVARAALRGEAAAVQPAVAKPAPALLAANERRRAPDAVLLALEVASQALAASGHPASAVASVFASTHGDLAVTDALCKTLAADPLLLSPTRFHHSVHNAASGYWAIGSGSAAASTALASFNETFATGLLEACVQCTADAQAVLLVACDTEATGALRSVNRSRGLLAVALLLSPVRGAASQWMLDWSVQEAAVSMPVLQSAAALTESLAGLLTGLPTENASAAALPLFEALAAGEHCTRAWPLSASCALQLVLRPLLLRPLASQTQAAA